MAHPPKGFTSPTRSLPLSEGRPDVLCAQQPDLDTPRAVRGPGCLGPGKKKGQTLPKAGQKPFCGVRGALQNQDLAGDSLVSWTSLSWVSLWALEWSRTLRADSHTCPCRLEVPPWVISALTAGTRAVAPALSASNAFRRSLFRPKNRRKPQRLATALKARWSGGQNEL